VRGQVDASGKSAVPGGLYDMAELGAALHDPELDAKIAETMKSLDKDFDGLKAKYKLEIAFEKRSMFQPFAGLVSAWTNGGFLNGGGDEALYFCPSKIDNKGVTMTCGAPIKVAFVSRSYAVCEKCRQATDPKKLVGQFFARLPMQHWATLITKMFRGLECSVDIRLGLMPGDLRVATEAEQAKELRGDKLGIVRQNREWVVYSLDRIVRDTASGADLQRRIRSFLSA